MPKPKLQNWERYIFLVAMVSSTTHLLTMCDVSLVGLAFLCEETSTVETAIFIDDVIHMISPQPPRGFKSLGEEEQGGRE